MLARNAALAALVPAIVLAGAALLAGPGPRAAGASVRGTVEILGRGGRAGDPGGAVVWLDRLPSGVPRPQPARTHVIETRDKQFRPRVLAVSAGDTVRFPNADPILHNVFSVSPGNSFDVGLYGKGEGKAVLLPAPGLVRAYCNVHAHMVAFLVVCPSPLFAAVRPDGAFEISPAPAGTYDVVVWHERGGTQTRTVTVGAGTTEVAFRLDASGFRSEPHLDKTGRPYRTRSEADPYR